jgi:TonB family protein
MFDALLESRHQPLGLPRWGIVAAVALHGAAVGAMVRPRAPRQQGPQLAILESPPFEPAAPAPARVPVVSGVHLPIAVDLSSLRIIDVPVPGIGVPRIEPEPASPGAPPPGPAASMTGGDLVPESLVQEPPELLTVPLPEYPRALREAGVDGLVVVQVVVDTLGHPEAGSLRVVQSSNAAFADAAVAAMRRALFRPGRVWGRVVRVLVRVPVAFRLHR